MNTALQHQAQGRQLCPTAGWRFSAHGHERSSERAPKALIRGFVRKDAEDRPLATSASCSDPHFTASVAVPMGRWRLCWLSRADHASDQLPDPRTDSNLAKTTTLSR